MKNIVHKSLISVHLAVLFVVFSSLARSGEPEHVAVEVRSGKVFIEGKRVTKESTLSDYQAILGKPDRVSDLENRIHTYDDLGILLYQKPGKDTIISISLDIIKSDYEFSPKKSFQGIFVVDSQVLRSDFPQSALLAFSAVKVDPEDKSLTFPVTKATYEDVVLILEYLNSRKHLEGVGISWKSGADRSTAETP